MLQEGIEMEHWLKMAEGLVKKKKKNCFKGLQFLLKKHTL